MKKRQRIVIISAIILLLLGLTYPTIAEIEKMHDPRPPIARFEWEPEFPCCEHGVTFISKSVKGPGTQSRDIVSWEWSFGATGETAIHSWDEAGEYDVTLTVTCEIGLSNSVTHKVCVGAGVCGVEGSINLRGRPGETVSDTFIVKNICTDPGSKLKWSIDSVGDFSISPESGELAKDESVEVTVSFTFLEDSSRFTEDYELYVINNLNQNDYEIMPVSLQCSKSIDILTFITEILIQRYMIRFPVLYRLAQEKI